METRFGDRLNQLMTEQKYTLNDLHKRIGMAVSTIGNYKTNFRMPDTDTIIKFAKLFNVSVDYMLGVTDIRQPYSNIDINSYKQYVEKQKSDIQEITDKKDAEQYMKTHAPLLWNDGLTDDETRKALWDILIENYLTARKNNREKLKKAKETKE